ncbi:MAG: hypothetical protein ACREL1_06250 [bacterium]
MHACKLGNRCLNGIGSTILTGAEIGAECIIGAGALVTEGMKIPAWPYLFKRLSRVVHLSKKKKATLGRALSVGLGGRFGSDLVGGFNRIPWALSIGICRDRPGHSETGRVLGILRG